MVTAAPCLYVIPLTICSYTVTGLALSITVLCPVSGYKTTKHGYTLEYLKN